MESVVLLIVAIVLLIISIGIRIAKICAERSKKKDVLDALTKDELSASNSESETENDENLGNKNEKIVDEQIDKRRLTGKRAYARNYADDSDIPEEEREDVIIIPRVTLEEVTKTENAIESAFSKIVKKPRVPFAKKILDSSDNVKSYYDGICNAFNEYKRMGYRVSKRGASFRYRRELIAKITVHGKTVKFNLALDPKAFDEKIYHQKDLSEKRAYEQVPFTVKLKSDRGYKYAVELVSAVAQKVGAQKKTKVNPVDFLAKLQEKLD